MQLNRTKRQTFCIAFRKATRLTLERESTPIPRLVGVKYFPYDFGSVEFHPLGSGGSADVMRVTYQNSDRQTVRKYFATERAEGNAFSHDDFAKEDLIYEHLKAKKFRHSAEYYGVWKDDQGHVFMEFDFIPGKSYFDHVGELFDASADPKKEFKRAGAGSEPIAFQKLDFATEGYEAPEVYATSPLRLDFRTEVIAKH